MAEQPVDLSALSDLRTPWCLHVAATLHIADHIAAGVSGIDQLAAAAGCDSYALHRVLTHLVDKGVFEEVSYGRFALNEAARQLLDPGVLLELDLNGIGGRMAGAWSTLPAYVRTGESAYQSAFGLPFFEDLAAHPEVAASFDALIGPMGHSNFDADFPLAGGWERVRHVVDVGGGTGAMLAALLRLHPTLKGTLVDQPGTVARAAATFQEAGIAERAAVVGQSFFDPLPAGADLYLLRGVINDWPDREAAAILRRCAEAARPGGHVVVLKGMIEDNTPHRVEIEMVLVGGKQRTLAEFRELGRLAGLELVAAGRQESGISVVELRPA
jgi:SAM-dependent methyltransferase